MFAVFLLCVLRATFRSRSNQTMGCATHHDHCAKSNVQCANMACGGCAAQTPRGGKKLKKNEKRKMKKNEENEKMKEK